MKPIIAFVAAFVVSTAASTGAKVALAKPEVKADSLKAEGDSTKKEQKDSTAATGVASAAAGGAAEAPAPAETAHVATAPADAAKPAATTTAATAPGIKLPTPPTPAGTAAAVTTNAATDTATQSAERRVAKVFTSMEAKQAARVLEHMSDGDIHIILGYVGPRQAASIMAELAPERVAGLAKLAMKGGK